MGLKGSLPKKGLKKRIKRPFYKIRIGVHLMKVNKGNIKDYIGQPPRWEKN